MGASQQKQKLTPQSIKFRQYEADLARKYQDLVYPAPKDYKHSIYIIGVSEHPDEIGFQFIFNDGTRTKANDSFLDKEKWNDIYVQNGATVWRAELMYDKNDMLLLGVKFMDKSGNPLL